MRFLVTDSNGNTNEILANLDFVQANFETFEIINEPVPEFIPLAPVPDSKIISKYQFLSRFTNAELEAIYTAAKTSVTLEVYLAKINAASEIDLKLSELVAGVNALESLGLIDVGRAAEILN